MNGGSISNNTAGTNGGGGVYIAPASINFIMNGEDISGNTAANSDGGGVYVSSQAAFTMNEGIISGNEALGSTSRGGGVYAASGAVFSKKNGGMIYGNDVPAPRANYAATGSFIGHAAYAAGSSNWRNTTAGTGIRLYAAGTGGSSTTTDPDDGVSTLSNWDQ